jgi:hypothetical protein
MSAEWTVPYYWAKIRQSGLKPTSVPTVYTDADNATWYVDDPVPMTPEERAEFFDRLERRRGRFGSTG